MFAGIPVAVVLLAQAASAAPASPPTVAEGAVPPVKASVASPREDCSPTAPTADQRSIVICAQRPNGYRLNPDVMEAKREKRKGEGGGPPGRPSIAVQTPCSVGPAPCQSAGINLIGAGITAVTMLERAAKGENVGDMFVTDPHPSEYQLYQMAKKRREAREAQEKAEAQAKARAAVRNSVDPSSVAQEPQ